MKIGLISDTHGFLDEAVWRYFEDCEEIWHAGDFGVSVAEALQSRKKLRGVFGNIDDKNIRTLFPEFLTFTIENQVVLMTHIGGYPPNYTPKIRKKLDEIKPTIFICGHSHIVKVMFDSQRKILHLNSGAAGHEGFHQVRSIMTFEIKGNEAQAIQNLQLIELGKRGRIYEK
jgi:putative phosphoesterase